MVQAVATGCRHHWVLTEPRDEIIYAVCKLCQASRRFPARLELTERFDDYRELAMSSEPFSGSIYELREEEQ